MNLVRTWPQGQAGPTPLGWTWPQPLMPPRIDGWPRGVVPSGNAEALLATAVGYWDASKYRNGDRFLRNQGVAGELLDLRLGSSVAPNTNDPTWLGVQDSGYVYLPGVNGNYLSVPDESALRITGDLDVRVQVAPTSYISGAFQSLLIKSVSGNFGYSFFLNTTGNLYLAWSPNNSTEPARTSTAVVSAASGTAKWLRATLDVDNGAAGHDVKFYTSDDGVAWTQLGTTVTTAGTTSIYAGTNPLRLGDNTSSNMLDGKVYRAIVKNGIDGTTVLDVDCDAITSGSATSFTATTGQTVSISRSTSGRKSVAQPARGKGGRACFLLGTDDYFEVPSDRVWQHQLLNFGQADSFTVLAVARKWATSPSNGALIAKGADAVRSAGFWLRNNGTAASNQLGVQDYNTDWEQAATSPTYTAGSLHTAVGIVDRILNRMAAWINATSGTQVAPNRTNLTNNTLTFRVGRGSGTGSNYADMEFIAAAIFRRALTQSEIQTLTDYYAGR